MVGNNNGLDRPIEPISNIVGFCKLRYQNEIRGKAQYIAKLPIMTMTYATTAASTI